MIATAIAHPNIALVKYWGKRDAALNLPAAGSLSVTLGPMHTRTTVEWGGDGADIVELNGVAASAGDARRISRFLDRVRAMRPGLGSARVTSANDFPTAAGLASSSSGFAALALAATRAAGLELDRAELSVLARLGSGSAARSLDGGLVRMAAGTRADGSDASAAPVDALADWPLRVVIAVTTEASKETSSTDGMVHTQQTSPYYDAWVAGVEPDVESALAAARARDFEALGVVAERSALRMHACAMASDPGVLYWRGATLEAFAAVRRLRATGVPVFGTIDAGPHVKAFTLAAHEERVASELGAVPGVVRLIRAGVGGAARIVGDA